jgi:hypothetical protein
MSDEIIEKVARAIEDVIFGPERNGGTRGAGIAGICEEAARQAIAAYMNAWRTTGWVYPARTHSPDGPLPPGECDSPSP